MLLDKQIKKSRNNFSVRIIVKKLCMVYAHLNGSNVGGAAVPLCLTMRVRALTQRIITN